MSAVDWLIEDYGAAAALYPKWKPRADRIQPAVREMAEMRALLKRMFEYTRHKPGCMVPCETASENRCTCGLYDALVTAKESV